MEIDESIFGKRKYNRGKRVKGKWILGGVERGTLNYFLVECPHNHRDHHTLVLLIKQHVRPGTIIITDGWKGYIHLGDHGYHHEDVNHSQNFVNPHTGAHTNTIEVSWGHIKKHCARGVGWLRSDEDSMAIALSEYMWLRKHDIRQDDVSCRKYFCKELPLLLKRAFA